MSPAPQDGLHRLEPRGAITAESDRCLRKVEQTRVHVQRKMSGPEVHHELSGHHVLIPRPVLGERLHPRLDASRESPRQGKARHSDRA
jgi:hypothetical protein